MPVRVLKLSSLPTSCYLRKKLQRLSSLVIRRHQQKQSRGTSQSRQADMNVPEDGDGRSGSKSVPRVESVEESRDPFESASKRQRINPFTVEDELNIISFAESSTPIPPEARMTQVCGLPLDLWARVLSFLSLRKQLQVGFCQIQLYYRHRVDLEPYREKVTDAIVSRILAKCPFLRSLSLKHCAVSDEVLMRLPSSLLDLNLAWCPKITGQCLKELPAHLKILNISWLYIKNDTISSLPRSIVCLRMCGLSEVSDDGLIPVLKALPLETLQISGCEKITDACLAHLPQTLKWLEAFSCKSMSEEALRSLRPTIHVIGRVWPSIHELRKAKMKGMLSAGVPFSMMY